MDALTVNVPVRGVLLLRFEGSEALHEVGTFEQAIPVKFDAGNGVVTISFNTMPVPMKEGS